MRLLNFIGFFLLFLTAQVFAQDTEWFCSDENHVRYINTALGKQKIMIFSPGEGEAKELIFFFHGDSAFRPPSYQYDMARRIVGHREGAMAVAVLRPGYEDGCGDKSDGDAGFKMGDNYTLEVVNALAEVIKAVQSEYPLPTTLFGHSGGAALSAILMNRHPDLANTALLAACPCDLTAWRQHMYERTGNERWISDIPGLSPSDEFENINADAQIIFFTASYDQITPVQLNETLKEKLEARNILHGQSMLFCPRVGCVISKGHDLIIEDHALGFVLENLEIKNN